MAGISQTAPTGYTEFKQTSKTSFNTEKIHDNNDNELWLIRVPDNVSLDKLKGLEIKLPSSKKQSRKPLAKLNDKNNEYALYRVPQANDEKGDEQDDEDVGVSGQEMAGFTCLLPEDGYLAYAPKEFSQYLILDEQVNVPDSLEIAKEISSRPPAKRDQPENLQMRFKPYGFDTVGVSSSQPTVSVTTTTTTASSSKSGGDKKRKRKEGEEKEKKKKSKKEKK
ncbi:DNA-directed RNA polymerase I, subunit RPA34.5 [Phascolomyces articulosus]|uniref:DNA-directed RNA polymerase I, subunit RPA34.5 n=1 Tax=Phascolomyces articulosus TaxID=60185 RepID=A0AAD5K5A0_9FUNG|nr:DNA-directed RNA polymerase I, subunit RPA34.5 [Phascolomyces articulosus]